MNISYTLINLTITLPSKIQNAIDSAQYQYPAFIISLSAQYDQQMSDGKAISSVIQKISRLVQIIYAVNIFYFIILNESVSILIKISLNIVPRDLIDNHHWFR